MGQVWCLIVSIPGLCPFSYFVFVMLSRQFIAEGKGLTSWLLFVTFVTFIVFCYFPNWYPGTGVVLDCIDS